MPCRKRSLPNGIVRIRNRRGEFSGENIRVKKYYNCHIDSHPGRCLVFSSHMSQVDLHFTPIVIYAHL